MILLKSIACFLLLLFLTCCVGCHQDLPAIPELKESLVEDIEFVTSNDSQPIPEHVQLKSGTGHFVTIKLRPHKDLPQSIDGHQVLNPEQWPLAILIFPAGKMRSHSDTSANFTIPFEKTGWVDNDHEPRQGPMLAGTAPFWFKNGFKGKPKAVEAEPGQLVRWSYMCVKSPLPGEYEYEVVAWPCCEQVKSSETVLGAPLVLRRGRITVAE